MSSTNLRSPIRKSNREKRMKHIVLDQGDTDCEVPLAGSQLERRECNLLVRVNSTGEEVFGYKPKRSKLCRAQDKKVVCGGLEWFAVVLGGLGWFAAIR